MASAAVYLGIWTNYSQGTVIGATLTTTQRWGNLLIAFTGFLIPYVASRFWRIICLVSHQCYSTPASRGSIHHQRQIILRNSASPETGLYSLFYLLWGRRHLKGSADTDYNRTHRITILAVCCIAGFTLAGGYSSRISVRNNEVLLRGDQCGIEFANYTTAATMEVMSENFNNAANYAQQCYSTNSSGLLDCDKFVVKTLPTGVSNNTAGCPFKPEVCRSNFSNIYLDTGYIDSNNDLGLNTPSDQRFALRHVLQCAPLQTEGHTTEVTLGNRTWVRYDYGRLADVLIYNGVPQNFAFETVALDSQYARVSGHGTLSAVNYQLSIVSSGVQEGKSSNSSAFIPSPQLFRPDGDLMIVFLSGNGVLFTAPVDDDWYRATVPVYKYEVLQPGGGQVFQGYMPVEAASPMGCVEQWQWCNSEYPGQTGCGPLASRWDAMMGAAKFFNVSEQAFVSDQPISAPASGKRFVWAVTVHMNNFISFSSVVAQLGAKSLSSQSLLYDGLQYPLHDNQWQLDAINWRNIMLASLQAAYVNTAAGTDDTTLRDMEVLPANSEEQRLCDNQKVKSTEYVSFNLFGLLFTYIFGALIVIISFIGEPILGCLYRRRRYKEYSYLEWTTNATLQLHRLAQEELGYGNWSGCTNEVPYTQVGDAMAGLDLSNPSHPLLAVPTKLYRPETPAVTIWDATSTSQAEMRPEEQSMNDSDETKNHDGVGMPTGVLVPEHDYYEPDERHIPDQIRDETTPWARFRVTTGFPETAQDSISIHNMVDSTAGLVQSRQSKVPLVSPLSPAPVALANPNAMMPRD